MNLTFKGFLKIYCSELAGIQTTNIRRLVNAANTKAPRVAEPLFVYANVAGKAKYLISVSENTWMYDDYVKLSQIINQKFSNVQEFLKSDFAPKRYAEVLKAYNSKDDILNSNRRILNKLRPKINDSLKKAGMSKYKVCKELGINTGNFYAYMNGDDSKISSEIAYAVISLGNSEKPIENSITKKNKTVNEHNEFFYRNGHRYIDVEFTDEELRILKHHAKLSNMSPDEYIKKCFYEQLS